MSENSAKLVLQKINKEIKVEWLMKWKVDKGEATCKEVKEKIVNF